jgi:hypothetical protein
LVTALFLAYGIAVSGDQANDELGISGGASAEFRNLHGGAVLL